ncbi:MAG: S8 family peptidase [Patescibacteria group bacterium]|nr:S8 family peptidase [Patescibacteria group bacterium]
MKRFFFLLAILLLPILLFIIKSPVFSASSSFKAVLKPDRIIVKFRPATPENLQNTLIKSFGAFKEERLKLTDALVVKIPEGRSYEFANKFIQSNIVEYAEPDFVATKLETPNDPYYPNQWGLKKIQAEYAWNSTHGLSTINVAIVDTGIDSVHPDLSTKIAGRANFTSDPDIDGDGHGTHVAGITASITNNSLGVAGVGYDTRLLSVKVLDNTGSGYYSWVANGIIWAADNNAKVINLSLGGTSSSRTLQDAVNYAWNKGVVVVAAAGNNNSKQRFYPAYYSNIIATAATDQNDSKASFSNYGLWVDVAAPGVSIVSTYKGDYTYLSGTSMAAPFVSGLAGLVFGLHTNWTNSQVRNKIESTTDKVLGTGKYWTYGRINACRAVDCSLISPTPTLTPTPTPSPTPTSTPAPTITPTPVSTQSANLTPEPTSTPKPWWCKYIPNNSSCQ